MAAPVVAAVATAVDPSVTATTITVNAPTGTTAGDVLVAAVTVRVTSAAVTAPAGWTLIRSNGTTSITLATFYKIAGASEPASYTFTTPASRQAAGIVRITGASTSSPLDAASGGSGTAATSLVAPTVAPASTQALLLECFGIATGTATITAPGGTTSDWSFTGSAVTAAPVNALAHEALSAAGSTGTRTATASVAVNYAAQLVAIQPPGSTGFVGWGVPI